MESSLRININKSNVYGVGVNLTETKMVAGSTCCAPRSLPFRYLGLSIGSSMVIKSNWNIVMERIRDKLSHWKVKLL